MTIYAIVNNLLSSSERKATSAPVWTIISQAAILQGGNPFFVPDFAKCFEARINLALRIGKLGKGIAPKFASRYIDAAAPGVLFVPTDMLQSQREAGLPWSRAVSYDKCLALGKFSDFSLEKISTYEINLALESNDKSIEVKWNADFLTPSIEETVAAISHDNTLKMGDIILSGICGAGPEVHPDMRVHLRLHGIDSLSFNIR